MTLGAGSFASTLVVGLSIFFVLVFGGALIALRRVAQQKEAGARQRYPNARRIDRSASFFGQASRGAMQLRGNGTLILTGTDLIFEPWAMSTEFRISLSSIQALENPKSFLGKSRFAPLLKVVFTNDQGAPDSMAWQVRNLDGWMRQINEARS